MIRCNWYGFNELSKMKKPLSSMIFLQNLVFSFSQSLQVIIVGEIIEGDLPAEGPEGSLFLTTFGIYWGCLQDGAPQ